MPRVPTRQWVVSVPIPLRYWMASSRDLTAQVHTIVRTTIAQYYVNQAVRRGVKRHKVQPGSVSFIQRFGGSINLNLHFHVVFLEGLYLDRSEAGLKPRFVKTEPPSNADIAEVLRKISRRVIRKLRRLGYLEAGIDVPVATGYDPLLDNELELARTMVASVKQRIAFGERAGEKVRRIGSGFGAVQLESVLGRRVRPVKAGRPRKETEAANVKQEISSPATPTRGPAALAPETPKTQPYPPVSGMPGPCISALSLAARRAGTSQRRERRVAAGRRRWDVPGVFFRVVLQRGQR